ncbi:MAG TPA: DUF1206 domain-containing protein [Longimicrobium sp.]|nr:DUF1206 domain-containing protein [Longimicrobium sp.]
MDTDAREPGEAPGRSSVRRLQRAADEMLAHAAAVLRRARAWRETPWARAVARAGANAGRAGYVAKGTLYCVVGGLAIDAGVRPYDVLAGARGAVVAVRRQWMGQAVVGVLAAGLAAYVFWQLVQAVLDPLRRARGVRGMGFRAVCVVSAALYGALALQGARLLAGETVAAEQRRRAVMWMRAVLAQPMGRWALLAMGLAVLAYAARQLVGAWRGPARSLDLSGVSERARRRLVWLAGAGLAARGIVAGIIAWFILRACVLYDPSELVGVAGALRVLREHEHGPTLLVLMGAGLVAYGVLQVLRARYWHAPH